ncbi:MAG: hypothetical protein ACOC5T_05760 [Elusimicrobiota bacterium]
MKVQYTARSIEMLPENHIEELFCKKIIRRMTDSNRLMGWYGDVKFDGEITSGYVITETPQESIGEKEE